MRGDEFIVADLIDELREELKAVRKQREAAESVDVEAEYQAQIATAEKRLAKARRAIDDRAPGTPIDPKAFDLVTKRSEHLDDIQGRYDAELAAKKKFLADWKKRTSFGLDSDAERAWKRERVRIMEQSSDAAIATARQSPMYSTF